jgi:hypothetical protein
MEAPRRGRWQVFCASDVSSRCATTADGIFGSPVRRDAEERGTFKPIEAEMEEWENFPNHGPGRIGATGRDISQIFRFMAENSASPGVLADKVL